MHVIAISSSKHISPSCIVSTDNHCSSTFLYQCQQTCLLPCGAKSLHGRSVSLDGRQMAVLSNRFALACEMHHCWQILHVLQLRWLYSIHPTMFGLLCPFLSIVSYLCLPTFLTFPTIWTSLNFPCLIFAIPCHSGNSSCTRLYPGTMA